MGRRYNPHALGRRSRDAGKQGVVTRNQQVGGKPAMPGNIADNGPQNCIAAQRGKQRRTQRR